MTHSLAEPGPERAYVERADALFDLGRYEDAAAMYERALEVTPRSAGVLNNHGIALFVLGRYAQALASYDSALALRPDYADAHYNRGNALRELQRLEEAIASYDAALVLQPRHAQALNNRGNVLRDLGRHREALESFERAIALDPQDALAFYNHGNILGDLGRLQEATVSYRQALSISPHVPQFHDSVIFATARAATDCADIFEQAKLFGAQFEPKIARLSHGNSRDPDRVLRVGYVSGDFREHSVAYFIGPLLANHDRSRIEVFCYSNHARVDDATRRLMRDAPHWRSIAAESDDGVAALVQKDAIDILVDLSGHTAHNRLLVFARKPAPVQVTWLGLPCTTGLSTIDYFLTNAYVDPEGMTERCYTEALVRLPRPACFEPAALPEVGALPALTTGSVTFGSFNDVAKISPGTYRTWARILTGGEHARLMMVCNRQSRPYAAEALIANGVDASQLIFSDKLPFREYLALHDRVDIALDTFPYNGSTTSQMALWMGVPLITLAGQTPVSRAGYALESELGLQAFVAMSEHEYVEIAGRWARNLPQLAEVRRTLRQRLRAAAMTDVKLRAQQIEAAYRRMWRTWCASA